MELFYFLGWDTKYTEIVPSERIRPKSTEPPITNRTFITFQLNVPDDLQVKIIKICVLEKLKCLILNNSVENRN